MENEGISNSSHLRVASFSCYLKPHEDNHFGFEKFLGMETGKGVPFKRFFHGFQVLCSCGTKGEQFAFPVLNPNLEILTDKQKQFEEASKKSFEVFGSERKLSVLTWDAIPKANDELMSVTCDDVASDTSSDLFEIEILSRTGSVSEFSSAFDEKKTDYTASNRQTTAKNKIGMQKRAKKTGASGFLWCKNHQSVKVAEPVCKTTNKSKH